LTDSLFSAPNLSLPERRPARSRPLHPLFPWRGDSKLCDSLDEPIAPVLALALPEEELALLREIRERVAEELKFEKGIEATMQRLRREIDAADGVWDLIPLQAWFRDLASGYYDRRHSAAGFLSLCAEFRDLLLQKTLSLAVENSTHPGRCAWFALGKTGRREGYPVDREDLVLVFDSPDAHRFADYRRRVSGLLADLAIAPAEGGPFREASLSEWRSGLLDELFSGRRGTSPESFADLRPLEGDAAVTEAFLNLLWGGLDLHRETLRAAARRTATLPLAVGFLGFMRVEKLGKYRGGVDLERYAIEPLAANVRMMAIQRGVRETGTLPRLQRLLELGVLDVAMTAELAAAHQTFNGIAVRRRIETAWKREEGRFVFPDLLSENETAALRDGLEAVGNLEKRIYSAAAHE
jgi:CBS domain-containing protein